MMRVADYIAKTIADYGVKHVFMVTGGGAMYLNNAFGSEERIQCVFNHHEQACAMAAEGYARITGRPGVINVTSGPGGINALNGVFGAWTDSIPMLVISGQVKRETLIASYNLPDLRQLGDQESNIISMVKGITKYASLVTDPNMVGVELERAFFLSNSGRPGPCWLDVPIDVQSSLIDEGKINQYDRTVDTVIWNPEELDKNVNKVVKKVKSAHRPVILAGTGIRLAGALGIFDRVVHKLGIPVTTAWTHDLIASDDPLFCGRPGTIGTRPGNFVVQNADVLLVLGSRLNIRQTSYNWQSFARNAFIIQVDVDDAELNKPTLKPDLGIHCDVKVFLQAFERQIDQKKIEGQKYAKWLSWCKERVARYPAVTPRQLNSTRMINPYHFIDTLVDFLGNEDVIVTGNASACIIAFQTAKIKKGQRLFSNSGSASMGYDLPAAIGAAFANQGKRVICLAGDGSVHMNIQELQTLKHYNLNIICFILNNNGYLSIRTTQKGFFGKLTGESPASGVSFPDYVRLAKAYGLKSIKIKSLNFQEQLKTILAEPGPTICEVVLDPDQTFEPRLSSKQLPDGRIISAALEDMYPYLDKKELDENIVSDSELGYVHKKP
jgi:acetolactate synthase-1/2/3 large subunit